VVSNLSIVPLEVTEYSAVPVTLGPHLGWHGTVTYNATGHSSRVATFTPSLTVETDTETHDRTGHGTIMLAQNADGLLEVKSSSGDWTEMDTTSIHVVRDERSLKGCLFDSTGTSVISMNGVASAPQGGGMLTFTGNNYELNFQSLAAMLTGTIMGHETLTVTGDCMKGTPRPDTTMMQTGYIEAQPLTVRGMLDPTKPDALMGKMDVMGFEQIPPTIYSVTWNLTRN
jgi:hypothetical protein